MQNKVIKISMLSFFVILFVGLPRTEGALPLQGEIVAEAKHSRIRASKLIKPKKKLVSPNANISLVFGLLSLLGLTIPFVPILFGVLAIIFGSKGIKKKARIERAKSGKTLGIVAIVLHTLLLTALISILGFPF